MKSARQLLVCVVTSAAGGFLLGGVVGGVEFLLLIPPYGFDQVEMPAVVLTYSLFWSLVAGTYGVVRCVLGGPLAARRTFLEGSVLAAMGALLVVLFEKANRDWFGSPLATGALITNLLILAFLIGFLWWVPRISRHVSGATPGVLTVTAGALWLVAFSIHWPWWQGPWREVFEDDSPRGKTPNVLMLLVDTLRADHLGVYGYPRDTSPRIDRLAADSVLFSHCVATSSWTKPSTASLLTGLFPASHGQHTTTSVLPPGLPMLPGAMGDHGYRTAYIVTNPFAAERFGFGQQVDFYREAHRLPVHVRTSLFFLVNELENWAPGQGLPQGSLTEPFRTVFAEWFGYHRGGKTDGAWANEMLLSWIDEQPDKPFFAYVHYLEPHEPYDPAPEFRDRFVDLDFSGPAPAIPPSPVLNLVRMPPLEDSEPLPEESRQHMIDLYDAEIAEFDARLGDLLQALEERGLYDETLIVLTSDHGEEFYEHSAWGHHHTPYEGLLHVPMILKLPRQEQSGLVVEGLCRQVDVLPTLLGLLGHQTWPGLQGADLSRVIRRGKRSLEPSWAVAETYEGEDRYASAYIEDGLKVIHVRAGGEAWQLFDLNTDPDEQRPLESEMASDLERMKHELSLKIDNLARLGIESRERELSEEEIRQLEALGYLGN